MMETGFGALTHLVAAGVRLTCGPLRRGAPLLHDLAQHTWCALSAVALFSVRTVSALWAESIPPLLRILHQAASALGALLMLAGLLTGACIGAVAWLGSQLFHAIAVAMTVCSQAGHTLGRLGQATLRSLIHWTIELIENLAGLLWLLVRTSVLVIGPAFAIFTRPLSAIVIVGARSILVALAIAARSILAASA